MMGCMLTNVMYNRSVWLIEWHWFQGWINFWPMLFCYDNRANPSSGHHDRLYEICVGDLGSDANKFCRDVTGTSNTYRLMAQPAPCLSIAHVFFIGLIFAALFHAMHKLQKQAIIHMTTWIGLCVDFPPEL